MKISVYVIQKNADLHAGSAMSLITYSMPGSTVKRISRFTRWDIELDGSEADARAFVEEVASKSYYLLNPNKEEFAFELPKKNHSDDHHIMRLTVEQRVPENRDRLKTKINSRFQGTISSLSQSKVWELFINEPKENYMLPESIRNLLVNPVHEVASDVSY